MLNPLAKTVIVPVATVAGGWLGVLGGFMTLGLLTGIYYAWEYILAFAEFIGIAELFKEQFLFK